MITDKAVCRISILGSLIVCVSLAACSVLLSSCGYTTRSMIRDKFRTIHITAFANKIDISRDTDVAANYKVYKPMLETDITRAVINKFLFDGNLKPVAPELSDLTLKGELVEFRREALRYTDADDVAEYRISLVVNLSLWDNKDNKLVWEERNFTGDSTYFVSGAHARSEDAAINDAITDLSRRIVERVVEQW
jgi:Lipopolysaccharide-assembly